MLFKFNAKAAVLLFLICCGWFFWGQLNVHHRKVSDNDTQKIFTLCSFLSADTKIALEINYIPYHIKTFSNIEPVDFNTSYWAQIKMSTREERQAMVDVCQYLVLVKDTGLPAPKSMDTRWSIHMFGPQNSGTDMLLYGTGKASGLIMDSFVEIPKELDAWIAKKFSSQDVYSSRNERWGKMPQMQKREKGNRNRS